MTDFTPIASLFGGVLIGLSALSVMFFFGRVAGISGISANALKQPLAESAWRVSFIIGLILAPVLIQLITGTDVEQTVSSNLVLMMVGGLLVGAGTVLGSGCTSGHGVCGLARLSVRSLGAVVTFMLSAAITVWVVRHVF